VKRSDLGGYGDAKGLVSFVDDHSSFSPEDFRVVEGEEGIAKNDSEVSRNNSQCEFEVEISQVTGDSDSVSTAHEFAVGGADVTGLGQGVRFQAESLD
jgi:hypothetical protein